MKKIGFIGYGHMGSVLLKSLLSVQAITPQQVLLTTRTRKHLDALKATYPMIELANDNCEVARGSRLLFLCVGTYQVKEVLVEILPELHPQTHLVTMAGGLEIASLEQLFAGAISKIMPTLLAEVHQGVTLLCNNQRVPISEQEFLMQLLRHIGAVKVIRESQFEVGADLTSCAPGLLASICENWVKAVVKHEEFTYAEAAEMLLQTLHGTTVLWREHEEAFTTFIQRVATQGGATEGGVSVLDALLPDVFEQMLAATLERYEIRKDRTQQQFLDDRANER